MKSYFILYVRNQAKSTQFYEHIFDTPPVLNVPGMTEFFLSEHSCLGLMPEAGIRRIIGSSLPDPASAQGIPRAELYLSHPKASEYYQRALQAGAENLMPFTPQPWGQHVAYVLDLDGHVLAFGY